MITAMKPDTAGYFVRLRETSVVCMRLEEEDGTLLMLMRELSVSDCDQHRWTDCQMMELFGLILYPFCSIIGVDEGRCD